MVFQSRIKLIQDTILINFQFSSTTLFLAFQNKLCSFKKSSRNLGRVKIQFQININSSLSNYSCSKFRTLNVVLTRAKETLEGSKSNPGFTLISFQTTRPS